ncbi:Nucleotidyltransferase domain protein [compost metagenome]
MYFPDAIENHAFATSSIRGTGEGMKANPKMSNPNVKSFANDCGKVMELGERNISFTTDTMSITMDENGVSFSSPARIEITPAEELLLGEVEPEGEIQGPPPLPVPKLVLKAEQSLSLMQGVITGLEIEDVHKLLSVKTILEGTSDEAVSYPMLSSPGQIEAVAVAEKLQNYKLSEQRKIGGGMKILNSLCNIVAGVAMVAVGAPVLAVGIGFGWTGLGILVAGAGGVGVVSGVATITSGIADLWEGIQDYSSGSKGDVATPSFNFLRDTLFGGNEEAYRMTVDITMIVGGLATEFAAPFMVLASGKGLFGFMNRGNSQKKPPEVPEGPEVPPKPAPKPGTEGTGQGLKVPQGLTQAQFDKASSMIREKVGHISDDIVVQGSRAKGTAKPTSDIDIAIRVPAEKFDELIQSSFSKVKPPNPGSAKEKTMLHAIETGKIQSGEAKLSKFREQLQQELGMDVDISIIKIGGPFDNPPFTPLK